MRSRGNLRGSDYALVWMVIFVETNRAQRVARLQVLHFGTGVYLNPNIGRFWTSDDEAHGDQETPKSLQFYSYAEGDPVNNIDPSGHDIEVAGDISSSLDGMRSPVLGTATQSARNAAAVALVLMESHKVAGDHNHCYVVLLVNGQSKFYQDPRFKNYDGSLHYATLGAGPEKGFMKPLLVNGINRKLDARRELRNSSVPIRPPAGKGGDDFIQMLLVAHNKYPNNLLYDLFPQQAEGVYNSNGYVSGLLATTTGVMPTPPPGLFVDGFDHPVPAKYFK